MKKILITAFDPFGGESINPSQEAVARIPARIGDSQIVKLTVPTSFARSFETVRSAIEKENPDYVVMVGQAGGRTEITPEKQALNRIDARIPDNDGFQPSGQTIIADAPEAYQSTLPVEQFVQALSDSGVPARLSETAGAFVCNYLFFRVMDYLKADSHTKAGFVHIPYETGQLQGKPDAFAMPIEEIVRGLEIMIRVLKKGSERG